MTTGLIRFNPEADIFRGRFDRVFNQMLNDLWSPSGNEGAQRAWMPLVDIRETADALTITAELPGLTRDDIQIHLEKQVLTLTGERKLEKQVEGEMFHRVERAYGTFSRTFTLPTGVQTDKVSAKFDNGVLSIVLPKVEESKPRKIDIG
ncbi:MAG: Hsp20/alpha crystallin family protein [Thermoanaerobaculia bacterium]